MWDLLTQTTGQLPITSDRLHISLHFNENVHIFLHFKENAHIFLHFHENACIFLHFQPKKQKTKFSDIALASSKGIFFERPNQHGQTLLLLTAAYALETKVNKPYVPYANIVSYIGQHGASLH